MTIMTSPTAIRPYNFSAGPAMLPEAVIQHIQDECLNWHDTGVSAMELNHRGPEFSELSATIERQFRTLLSVPDNYQVLFLHGGASHQFAQVPMNLMGHNPYADYVVSGYWSQRAFEQAVLLGQPNTIAKWSEAEQGLTIPDPTTWQYNQEAAYCHITPNETIVGLAFERPSDAPDSVVFVADMTSCLLSEPVDVSQYGIIYAGAQKNLGIAGLTVVIVRDDLLEHTFPWAPPIMRYKTQAEHRSLFNTPPLFAWYVTGLMVDWIEQQGGLEHFKTLNQQKADLLYQFIDEHPFYYNRIDPRYRSKMNISFQLIDETLNEAFLSGAQQQRLLGLKGHRSLGGMRASLYNAMPLHAVEQLVEFMKHFAEQHGG